MFLKCLNEKSQLMGVLRLGRGHEGKELYE